MQQRAEHGLARLTAAPGDSVAPAVAPGLHSFEPSPGRQHLLYVPATIARAQNGDTEERHPGVPLVVMLHGSGSDPLRTLPLVEAAADAAGAAVLLPKSAAYTWDALLGAFGPDVSELDRLLAEAFRILPVAHSRTAIAGFSDGASYALSLGRANGDRFGAVLAFSPGFVAPTPRRRSPRIFISHGTSDPVLPIERCSRLIVPALRREGYPVDYREFDGGHAVPPELALNAFDSVRGADRRT